MKQKLTEKYPGRPPLVTGAWTLEDLRSGKLGSPKNGLNVFSCFHCGGGSTMGYKLAGFNVLGGVEIDPEMMKLYRKNHSPKHSFLMGVQEFKNIPNDQLPRELFSLDVLDGSPPCSSFSMAGAREDAWSEKKKFREGQAEQVLDDLFFHFIDIAKKLQPRVVVAENVKGLVTGRARGYVKEIFSAFRSAGYETQLFLVNAAACGVPQRRERTFFIARKSGPKMSLVQNERPITTREAFEGLPFEQEREPLSPAFIHCRKWCRDRMTDEVVDWVKATQGVEKFFTHKLVLPDRPAKTLCSSIRHIHYDYDTRISDAECIRLQSFPEDYDLCGLDAGYICGMSVPPFMMQRVATEIAHQLF